MFITEFGHHVVPMCGPPQYTGRDPAASWSDEEPSIRPIIGRRDPLEHQWS